MHGQELTGIPAKPEFRPEFSLKFRFRPDFLFWPEFQAGNLIKIVSNNWCKMFVKTQIKGIFQQEMGYNIIIIICNY